MNEEVKISPQQAKEEAANLVNYSTHLAEQISIIRKNMLRLPEALDTDAGRKLEARWNDVNRKLDGYPEKVKEFGEVLSKIAADSYIDLDATLQSEVE